MGRELIFMIKEEDIQSYINYESNVPKRKGLWSFLWTMLIVCVPTAIFGTNSDITKVVLLPLVIILSFWIIYLLIKTETKKIQFVFFLGVYSVFISISFLIAAYKIAVTEMRVSMVYVLIIIMIYITTNMLGILNTLRLIKKGYFTGQRKTENSMGVIFAASFLGLGIGKMLIGKINQDTVVAILVILLIFLGFLFSTGSHNFIKYYFAKKLMVAN